MVEEKQPKSQPKLSKAPKNNRTTAGRFNYILRDLKKMKLELLGDDAMTDKDLELQGMTDEWQRNKYRLTKVLSDVTTQVQNMQEIMKERGGQRDAEIIGMRAALSKDLKSAETLYEQLKKIFDKDSKKKSLDAKTVEERRKYLELLSNQMNKLRELVSGVRSSQEQQQMSKAITDNTERRKRRQAEREAKRQARAAVRRAGRNGGGGGPPPGDVELDDMEKQPASLQEQKFFMEVQQNDKKIDEMLDVLSVGLKNLNEMALDMNRSLDVQAQMLEEVSDKMDDTIEKYSVANARLKELLEKNTGGVETWCPIVILIVILLGVIGYLFTVA